MLQNTFIRRLFYYLIGFVLGLILVFLFFGNKGCSWLPSNQVRDVISKKFIISTSQKFNAQNISSVLENAEIDFEKSDKLTTNKTYFFKLKNNSKPFYITYSSESYYAVIHESQKELKKFTSDTILKIVSVPNGTNSLVNFEESNPLKSELAKVKMDYANYHKTLIRSGYLTFNVLKPNNNKVEIIIKDPGLSKKLICSWKNYVLTPLKIEK